MVKAYAAMKPGAKLETFEYDLGPMNPDEIDIKLEHCGICHTDISMIDNDWNLSQFPLVGGHEAIGTVTAVGDLVTHVKVGDRVGLGGHSKYCMSCPQCLTGDQNLCASAVITLVGRHGAFADMVRASGFSVVKLPEGIDPKVAGPLYCGGVTVFNPMLQFGIKPTGSVAILGIGGLGHMALQFARASGFHVTALTHSESKIEEALKLGAHECIDINDPEALKKATRRFDLILSTIYVKFDWNTLIPTLKPRGRLHFVGIEPNPIELNLMPMYFGQLSISASAVGSPQTIEEMLLFAALHKIQPVTEHFKFDEINDAIQHFRDGKARYRIVLDF